MDNPSTYTLHSWKQVELDPVLLAKIRARNKFGVRFGDFGDEGLDPLDDDDGISEDDASVEIAKTASTDARSTHQTG